jgi:putative FmdB family regulatory protein
MPIYEYECQSCGHVLDALQKISDDPLTHCPSCGEAGLKKLLSAPRFRLKGSGWYETDFKDGNRRNLASGDSAKPDAAKGKEAGKDKTADKAKPREASKPAPAAKKESSSGD